jgi:two-component system NtrC family response regulator
MRILVVDDEPKWRALIGGELEDGGHEVMAAEDGQEALDRFQDGEVFDLILTDLRMEPVGGLELMRRAREVAPDTDVIMITAYADARTAVEAMKLGAYDFLAKPFELDELVLTVARVQEKRGLRAENRSLRAMLQGGAADQPMVGSSDAMQRVFELIEKVAGVDATVLIRGESGTGKELVARLVHDRSRRASGPFKAVNCAALPETLLESELFGHERGAFTGAERRRIGLFEAASGGTLLLDEIGEVSPSVQSKLLRALEEREITRIGSTESIRVDTRVVAATNVDLEGAIRDGVFREDLYYRLNVFPIALPPLRERPDDIPELVRRFLADLAPGEPITVDPAVLARFQDYTWPGNVRELRNVIERATILAGGVAIGPEHVVLPDGVATGGMTPPPAAGPRTAAAPVAAAGTDAGADAAAAGLHLPPEGIELEALEARFIREALTRARGNKSQAARLLGITRRALYCRMEKYGIAVDAEGRPDEAGR